MRRHFIVFCALIFSVVPLLSISGQTPAPVIIQAATPVPAVVAKPAAALPGSDTKTTLQLLQEMQATNAATIKKQEAALESLDVLQKAAEEIKIYSKRG